MERETLLPLLLKMVPALFTYDSSQRLELKIKNFRLAGELNDKFQGDIILTKKQEEELFGLHRTGLVNENYRWPNNTVVYEISTAFAQDRVESIELGLRRIEEVTCIRFVKRTTEVNYVYVTVSKFSLHCKHFFIPFYQANNAGCSSNVGYLNSGMQRLNLEPGDFCFRIGTIIHEFLHTLGFYHMHSATERDDFVTIMWENILPGTEGNFNTYGADRITNFGVEYGKVPHTYTYRLLF